jgi:hypothetical protein
LKLGKVRLHRYICLWGASERKLGKSSNELGCLHIELGRPAASLVQFSLDYKGLQPGTAAQPIGVPTNNLIKKIDSCTNKFVNF